MVQEDTVLKTKLKHRGNFDFKGLYEFCFDWFEDNNYHISEKKYTEKIGPEGKQIEITWTAEKKVTDYFKYSITLDWRITRMKEVEVEQDGKKIPMNKGEVKIAFRADLVKDYEERWEDRPLWKFMRGVYDKYIIRTTTEDYEEKIEGDTLELISQIKAFLGLGR